MKSESSLVAIKGTKHGLTITLQDGPIDATLAELNERLTRTASFFRGAQVTLYSENPLQPPALAERVVQQLRRRKVDFRPGMAVTSVEAGPVVIAGSARQAFDLVVLATGAKALPWLRESGLATDERGFALVRTASGAGVRSVAHVAAGDRLDIELADGHLHAHADAHPDAHATPTGGRSVDPPPSPPGPTPTTP